MRWEQQIHWINWWINSPQPFVQCWQCACFVHSASDRSQPASPTLSIQCHSTHTIHHLSTSQRSSIVVTVCHCQQSTGCCCCDSPADLLLSSVVQVEEVCDRSRVVPQVLHCKLHRMALTVEQMLYRVWCHSTLRTDIWYATGDADLVTVLKPTVTRTQLGETVVRTDRGSRLSRGEI